MCSHKKTGLFGDPGTQALLIFIKSIFMLCKSKSHGLGLLWHKYESLMSKRKLKMKYELIFMACHFIQWMLFGVEKVSNTDCALVFSHGVVI